MNLNEWRPGHQPHQHLQVIAQRTLAVEPKKKSWRSQAQFFNPIYHPNSTRNEASTQNKQHTLKVWRAAPSTLFRAWRFRAPSSQPRDPESDSFRACAAKPKQRGRWQRTRDDACRRSRLLSSVFISRALCDMLCFPIHKIINSTRGFPIGTKTVFFHQIESNSIRFKT